MKRLNKFRNLFMKCIHITHIAFNTGWALNTEHCVCILRALSIEHGTQPNLFGLSVERLLFRSCLNICIKMTVLYVTFVCLVKPICKLYEDLRHWLCSKYVSDDCIGITIEQLWNTRRKKIIELLCMLHVDCNMLNMLNVQYAIFVCNALEWCVVVK